MTDPLLAQYAVLSDRGLHFGRLYWQNIAFHLVMLLAAAAIFRDLEGAMRSAAFTLAGLATILMSLVVWRVWLTERKYDMLLAAIETALREQGHSAIQSSPVSDRRGARFAVIICVGVLGVALLGLGLTGLAMPAV